MDHSGFQSWQSLAISAILAIAYCGVLCHAAQEVLPKISILLAKLLQDD
jgi:hypothetical protein